MKRIRLFTALGFGVLPMVTFSQVGQIAEFEQQNRHQREDFWQLRQQQWLNKKQYQVETQQEDIKNLPQVCLPYTELRFRGVNAIDHRPFIPAKGECLNEARLNQLSRDLTAAYLKKGILHAPFQFEVTDKDQLVMVVKEGRLRQLETESKRLNFATLLPYKRGQILTVQDLDQALDQANKMRGSQVTVDVFPVSNGDINLRFVNQESRAVQGYVGLNNFASKAYHRWQARTGLNIDSPFGLSDILNLNISHTLDHPSEYSRSASLYYSVPYGYWSVNAFGSFAQFRQQLNLPHTQVEQRGRTVQGSLGLDYVAHRGSNFVTTVSANLERQDNKNRFADAVLVLQSPNLTAYQVALNHLQLFPNGALSANVAYKHGLPWFNALPNQGSDQPQGQYAKWTGELYFQHYHSWFRQHFKQSHRLQGQYSRYYLAGAEQADLTGRYAVRGLNDLNVSAEKSLVLRNQLAWVKRWEGLNWSPYLALDLGVAKVSDGSLPSQRAFGYAVGISLEQQARWNALLEWASGRLKTDKYSPSLRQQNLDLNVEVIF